MRTALALALALGLGPAACAAGHQWENDLRRARTPTPRSGFQGQGTLASANAQLNKHLSARPGLSLKACEDFGVHELRGLLKELLPLASDELKAVYPQHDGRRAVYGTVAEMEAHWAEAGPGEDARVRDAHCHEVVMWFIHHLSSEVQAALSPRIVLPKLPVADHRVQGARAEGDTVGKFYDQKVTCQACHVGGIPDLGVPEVKPETAQARSRRCYTNYKELFGITCGPCDGVGGPYWGDADKDFKATPCVVVAEPEYVPESERVPLKTPSQFTVDVVGGSDRFGRTTNPVHDQMPGPLAKIYGQISGKWYLDAKPGADLWLLRHDTKYGHVTENGIPIPLVSAQVTEIHAQTAKQRATNQTGPMVSLINGMPSWIPGGCTCMPDPVGVPDVAASWAKGMGEFQYMGRIRLPQLEYLNVPIELDHWANWFFHAYMDTNKSAPHYGQAPSRISSAYAGFAVYNNWVFGDPKVAEPDVWHRGIPTKPMPFGPDKGQFCMNTKKAAVCDGISQATFPPAGEPPASHPAESAGEAHHALPFFQAGSVLGGLATHLMGVGSPSQVVV